MNPMLATIPDEVLTRIQGKMVIEAGVATGPSFIAFAGNTFDPPIELESGLDWIVHTLASFKAAHVKLDDHTVLWFRFNAFKKYQTEPVKALIRPVITIPSTDMSERWSGLETARVPTPTNSRSSG